jgi:hypothetical protein
MNDKECDEVYQRLTDMVNQIGLEWVIAQVAEQIRLWKTVEKEIETLRETRTERTLFTVNEYRSEFRKGPKATFPVTVEYSSRERLSLLIDAIEQAVVNTADMEHHLLNFFDKATEKWDGVIQFYSEEPDIRPRSIDKRVSASRLESSRRLRQLLDNLRQEI